MGLPVPVYSTLGWCRGSCEHNECVVAQAAKWATKRGYEPEEAKQEAWVFLLEARKRWQAEKGPWGRFAYFAVIGAFIKALQARRVRVQPADQVELHPWGLPPVEAMGAKRLDAKRALEAAVTAGVNIDEVFSRGSGAPSKLVRETRQKLREDGFDV